MRVNVNVRVAAIFRGVPDPNGGEVEVTPLRPHTEIALKAAPLFRSRFWCGHVITGAEGREGNERVETATNYSRVVLSGFQFLDVIDGKLGGEAPAIYPAPLMREANAQHRNGARLSTGRAGVIFILFP